MTETNRRQVIAAMAAGALARPAWGQEPPRPEGGIGGTGIVGVLTDLSSVVLNGLRVETAPFTRIVDAFGRRSTAGLALGQSLTVEAERRPGGGLVARRIAIDYPVVGPVEAADGSTGTVAGVPVRLEPGGLGVLRVGDTVAVSGVWDGRTVVASRVALTTRSQVALAGVVERARPGAAVIAGRPVRLPLAAAPRAGRYVTVVGRLSGGVLLARRLSVGRFSDAAGGLGALSVEGFLEPQERAPFAAISGLGHSFDEAARLDPFRGRRSLFVGPYTGEFEVDAALALPERFDTRRALNRRLLAGEAIPFRPAR